MESNDCPSAEYNHPDLQFGDEEMSIYAIFPLQISPSASSRGSKVH
jgi:hypothetical protein